MIYSRSWKETYLYLLEADGEVRIGLGTGIVQACLHGLDLPTAMLILTILHLSDKYSVQALLPRNNT